MSAILKDLLLKGLMGVILIHPVVFFQENFEFKKPSMPASRCRTRYSGGTKDAFAGRPNSAPALMVQHAEPVEYCS